MTKRTVVRVAARGYVDGRYIGEEKEVIESIDPSGRGKKRRGKPQGKGAGGAARGEKNGNTVRTARGGRGSGGAGGANAGAKRIPGVVAPGTKPRGKKRGARGDGAAQGQGQGQGRRLGENIAGNVSADGRQARGRGRNRNTRGEVGNMMPSGNSLGGNVGNMLPPGEGNRADRGKRGRGGKRTPFRAPQSQAARPALISEVAETMRWGDESKSGQFAEALAKESKVKRDRLHKVLAQSGHGSRRDMEIMISSGRVMVNGIVATTGTSVSPLDMVMVDHRPVKLKFGEDLPRVLLYHKPDGEIVSTNDPGNRITVFDNLPPVENGKWMSIGRLDINTSGLLIFTTNGELANRLMHPRYEVEREYAVRVLGELTEEQTQRLLDGVQIDTEADEDEEVEPDERPAKFDSIEARGGEGANHWYHVVIREGRNREVRKMFEAVGLTVSRLIRVRFGKIGLPPRLSRGRMMELAPEQVRAVLKWVGMEFEGRVGALPTNAAPRSSQSPQQPRSPRPPRLPREGGQDRQDSQHAQDNNGVEQDNDFELVDGQTLAALNATTDAMNNGGEAAPDGAMPTLNRERNPRHDRGERDGRNRRGRRGRNGRRDDRTGGVAADGAAAGITQAANERGFDATSNDDVGNYAGNNTGNNIGNVDAATTTNADTSLNGSQRPRRQQDGQHDGVRGRGRSRSRSRNNDRNTNRDRPQTAAGIVSNTSGNRDVIDDDIGNRIAPLPRVDGAPNGAPKPPRRGRGFRQGRKPRDGGGGGNEGGGEGGGESNGNV
jgi:23S rRNA pseudouridine2605 synthase